MTITLQLSGEQFIDRIEKFHHLNSHFFRRLIFLLDGNTFSLNKKVSSILVMIVIIKLCIGVIFRNTFSLNRKASSILVMIVIIKLHIRVIFRNTFSLHTKQEVIMYPCNDCDYKLHIGVILRNIFS